MTTVLLIIHLLTTLALIGLVLIQRSAGGGLGIGSSQEIGGFMSGWGTANLLTRTMTERELSNYNARQASHGRGRLAPPRPLKAGRSG